ncbi:MAG: hypothetical protein LBG52_04095 [Candidatus Peribacteria bacterium]|jgi:hypothetical protein|nr:hypothetical protein [Candidatus Peribacteria bacterium]
MKKKIPSLVTDTPALSYSSNTFLLKEELAQLVVISFDIKLNERSLPVFSDISRSPYLDQIQKLSKLGLVS